MQKFSKKTIGLILAIILCVSMIPMSAMATGDISTPDSDGNVTEEQIVSEPEDNTSVLLEEDPVDEVIVGKKANAADTQIAGLPQVHATDVGPFAEVAYCYYDEAANQDAAAVTDYSIESTHSYNALATVSGDSITIAANKYPGIVPVSADADRFRVLLDGKEDITGTASYDAATGLVSLPQDSMGNTITVEWYCPTTDIVEVTVKATVGVYSNGHSELTEHNLTLASNANAIEIPLSGVDRIVVNQNGLDLFPDEYSLNNGMLTVNASALGGDLNVSAFPAKSTGGISLMSGGSTVNHERQHYNSVNYGYVTSYYVANGNVAYCLDPSVSGVNTGTYDVSGYLDPGTGRDNIIKAAWYLYRCPGEDSSLFTGLDWEHAYGYSHVAASYIYLETIGESLSKAWEGIESDTAAQNRIMGIVNAIKGKPMPPSGFTVFLYNVGNQSSQSLMGWDYNPNGSLEIQKASGNTDFTDGNGCYSLEGAVFEVFDSGDNKIGAITTDKNGKGKLEGIPAGTGYYLVEKTPPKGYAESKAKIPFEIVSGQTTTKTIKNNPQGDPADILLIKLDDDTGEGEPQGAASLAGAQFTIKFYKGHYKTEDDLKGKTPARQWIVETDEDGFAMLDSISLVSGDPFYFDSTGKKITLPLGTITVRETKAPAGYLINDEVNIRLVTANTKVEGVTTYNAPEVSDKVIRGGVTIEKRDDKLDRSGDPQGDATLAGAVLEIFNRNSKSVVVDGKNYSPGAVVYTMTTNDEGVASTPNNFLPYGSYEIIEKTAPTGYLNSGTIRQPFKIEKHNVIVDLYTSATAIKNTVISGDVEIEKWDIERDERALKQGDATLAGAVLEIWNRSAGSVVVGGTDYAPNTVVHTLVTDANGRAGTSGNLLPHGSYEIIEKTAPTGYLNTGIIKQPFKIRDNGVVVSLKASNQVIKNNIIRGGVRVEKFDNEIDRNEKQGGATLEHAVFELVNRSIDSVFVLDTLYAPGEVVYVFETDEKGSALTANDLLPYGTYEVREIAPPEGYLATGVLSRMFEVREHGKIVELDTSETAIKNNPIRGDLCGVKISDGDGKRLGNIPFAITSLTTGESHTIVTDKNGEFSTASSWNPHSQNTNRGESDRDGIWFGELWTLNDDVGALLYDDYLIEELPCENNKDRELLSFEVSIYRHNHVIDLGTLTNDYTQVPEIFTTALDTETMTNDAFVSETTTIRDTLYYSGLKVGTEYVAKGWLMDRETGEPLLIDGERVTAEKAFKALTENGTVAMDFTFNSLDLKGKSVVVFEALELDGKEIASHFLLESAEQTISFKNPVLGTTATGSAGEKELDISEKTVIKDVVAYEGLVKNQTYDLHGILMDKETGEPLLIDGEQVVVEKSFVAKEESGTVEMEFVLNSLDLKGKSVVVFEYLSYQGREVCVHADISLEGQTVTFKMPGIRTSAAGTNGGKEIIVAGKVEIVDRVAYENLAVGKSFVVKGRLMDKSTGKPLVIDGKEVVAETAFTAAKPSGAVDVTFTFDASALYGKEVVVFEKLYYADSDVVIATHEDITDQDQSVRLVSLAVQLTKTNSATNETLDGAEFVLKDATGTELKLAKGTDGAYYPDENGSTVITTNGGKALISGLPKQVYTITETKAPEGFGGYFEPVALDVTEKNTTDNPFLVTIMNAPEGSKSGTGAKTGGDGLPMWMLYVGIAAAAAGAVITIIGRKRKIKVDTEG